MFKTKPPTSVEETTEGEVSSQALYDVFFEGLFLVTRIRIAPR